MHPPSSVRTQVPLAPLTTLEVGGPARYLAEVDDRAALADLLAWARAAQLPVAVLGGGSNLLVADAGFDGLVIRFLDRRVEVGAHGSVVAGAGVEWDALVARTVEAGLAGLECLSGIPGLCGAAPVQNIGAYGQELGDTLRRVRAVRLTDGAPVELTSAACALGYRTSRFKRDGQAPHLIVELELELSRAAPAPPRYAELRDRLGDRPAGLTEVREAVLALRRHKSMLLDPADPNHRSAGSFFVNPVVAAAHADALALSLGPLPRFPLPDGRVKLTAAWLVERAGFPRGTRRGAVGLSSAHALALVNHGGARAADLVALAREIIAAVERLAGVTLCPEPATLGFAAPPWASAETR